MWEYKDRGKKGYDLTERFFLLFRSTFPDLHIKGPERAGKDVLLGKVFENYPKPDRPVDFVICDASEQQSLPLVWLAMILTEVAHKRTTALAAIRIVPMKS